MRHPQLLAIKQQSGAVLVFALLILLCVTILGVSAVSSSLLQNKMAVSLQQNGLSFDAAEAAIAGVVFESEDEVILSDDDVDDPLSEARQGLQYDPTVNSLVCSDANNWTNRQVTNTGLTRGVQQTLNGNYQAKPAVNSWSRTAFLREQACRGSSNVVGGSNLSCHVFVIKGCGQVVGKSTVTVNTLAVSVFGPSSN